jgi:drug/metabolite transporter (DMT)-like permease
MNQRKSSLDGLAVAMLLACCVFWGFQQVLVKATIPEVAPIFQAAIRFAGAVAVLMLWARWRGVALFAPDGSLQAGLLAGVLFAVEFAFLYTGLRFTSASRLTLLLYTAPFWVAILVPLFVKSERLGAFQWGGLALAFGGVLLAFLDNFSDSSRAKAASAGLHQQGLGDLLALGGGLCWGLTTVIIRSSSLARVSAEKLLFYQIGVSALTLPWLSLALGEAWNWHFSPFAITSLLLQTVVGAFASFLAWMWLLGRYPATRISVFVFLTPVFALIIGAGWLGEPITPNLMIALVLVALGIVAVGRKS